MRSMAEDVRELKRTFEKSTILIFYYMIVMLHPPYTIHRLQMGFLKPTSSTDLG
jgi:hypothetical protein